MSEMHEATSFGVMTRPATIGNAENSASRVARFTSVWATMFHDELFIATSTQVDPPNGFVGEENRIPLAFEFFWDASDYRFREEPNGPFPNSLGR